MTNFTNTELSLTFGIELEAIFIFHEHRLQNYLDKQHNGTTIVKNIHSSTEQGFRQPGYGDLPYTSWALRNPDQEPPISESIDEHLIEMLTCRAYTDEPLQLVRDIACQVPGKDNIRVHHAVDWSKQSDYSEWSISGDRSLNGLSKPALVKSLNDRIPDLEAANDWDSWGIELISPPFTDAATAREEVAAIIEPLRGASSSDFGMAVSDKCGTHVHVGLPDIDGVQQRFDIRTLQHLAYLLIVYEEEISQLHEPQRQQAAEEILSNRENFLVDGDATPVERLVVNPDTGESERKKFVPIYKSLGEIRELLFETVDRAGDPLKRLIAFMGRHRGHIVSFAGLTREGRPHTVEFRQHAGTLSAEGVFWWVWFCTGLVQLAHRYAVTEGEYPVSDWDDRIDVEDLFEAIGLPEDGREYFRKRRETYAAKAPKRIGYWEEWEDYEMDKFDDEIRYDSTVEEEW